MPAVRRAASILWELADGSTPMSLSQISRAVDVIPSTCLHILRELATARFVSYDPGSKTYQLGSGITIWRAKRLSSTTLRILSGPGFSRLPIAST